MLCEIERRNRDGLPLHARAAAAIPPLPHELWIIRINRQRLPNEPTSVEEIEDRRNALAGNLLLNHEVDTITTLSRWLREGKLTGTSVKPVDVHWIEMSDNLTVRLGYVTRLNRDPDFLSALTADGEAQAEAFLQAWAEQG